MKIEISSITQYYDRVVVLSSFTRKELIKNFADIAISDYCLNKPNDPPIKEATNSAKYHEYYGKIDLKVVTDDFFTLLTPDRIGKCTISYIEVAQDFECSTKKQAGQLHLAFYLNNYCKWKRLSFEITGEDNSSTDYIGKGCGKKSTNYIACYVRANSKITGMPVFHIEFRLSNWSKIQKLLNISHPSECPPAEKLFSVLEKRYISFPAINSKRLYNAVYEVGRNRDAAQYSIEKVRSIYDLKQRIEQAKDSLLQKIITQKLNKSIRGRSFNISSCRKKVLNWKITDFLDYSAHCNNISTFFNLYFT